MEVEVSEPRPTWSKPQQRSILQEFFRPRIISAWRSGITWRTFYRVLMASRIIWPTLIYVRAHSNMRSQDNISTPTINSWSIYSLHILTAVSEQALGQFAEQREWYGRYFVTFSSIKHDLARSCFQLWPKIGDEGDKISSPSEPILMEANFDAERGIFGQNSLLRNITRFLHVWF